MGGGSVNICLACEYLYVIMRVMSAASPSAWGGKQVIPPQYLHPCLLHSLSASLAEFPIPTVVPIRVVSQPDSIGASHLGPIARNVLSM